MFASKQIVSSSNPSSLHLPTVPKPNRRRSRHSPTPSYVSMTSAAASTNVSENVSALKAKYFDYAMWLKASSRQNREPLFTHELLKHSLCQMGIDSTQAEQLVSTCSWYVYQFQKELEIDHEQPSPSISGESKLSERTSRRRVKKAHKTKSKKGAVPREHSSESATTVTSINKDSIYSPGTSAIQKKCFALPAIHKSDPTTASHSRHVDFNNEQVKIEPPEKAKHQHGRSALTKTQALPKIRTTDVETASNSRHDVTPESTPIDLDLSSSHKALRQPTAGGNHRTRSILRKQISVCTPVESTDADSRRIRSRMLTPTSAIIDEMPLGTKSKRLFGGSECFAQIMNELEQQNSY